MDNQEKTAGQQAYDVGFFDACVKSVEKMMDFYRVQVLLSIDAACQGKLQSANDHHRAAYYITEGIGAVMEVAQNKVAGKVAADAVLGAPHDERLEALAAQVQAAIESAQLNKV